MFPPFWVINLLEMRISHLSVDILLLFQAMGYLRSDSRFHRQTTDFRSKVHCDSQLDCLL